MRCGGSDHQQVSSVQKLDVRSQRESCIETIDNRRLAAEGREGRTTYEMLGRRCHGDRNPVAGLYEPANERSYLKGSDAARNSNKDAMRHESDYALQIAGIEIQQFTQVRGFA